jgi:small subunit ribosomal protein S16
MAVVIRMARVGKKHAPQYRITVADSRRPVSGKFIEVLGAYNPTPKGQAKKVSMKLDRYQYWLGQGAKPTERVQFVAKLAQSQAVS